MDAEEKRKIIEAAACICGHAKAQHEDLHSNVSEHVEYGVGKCHAKIITEDKKQSMECPCTRWESSILDCGWTDEGIPYLGDAQQLGLPLSPEQRSQISKGYLAEDKVQNQLKVLFLSHSSLLRRFDEFKIRGAGLDNWRRLLGADMLAVKELGDDPRKVLENYDLIHINLSNEDVGLVTKVYKWLGNSSDTAVMANNDYSVETLQTIRRTMDKPLQMFIKDVLLADILIAQEPFEYELFKILVDQYKETAMAEGKPELAVPKIGMASHPINTKKVKSLEQPLEMRMPQIGCNFHKYDDHVDLPALLMKNLPNTWFNGQPPVRALFGYTDIHNLFGKVDNHFDAVYNELQWVQYVQFYGASIAGLEYYTVSSHSRNAAESACLRIPLVSTRHSHNCSILFPELCHPHYKLTAMRESLQKVLRDEEYWDIVTDYAYEEVEQFNYENSWERLKEILAASP